MLPSYHPIVIPPGGPLASYGLWTTRPSTAIESSTGSAVVDGDTVNALLDQTGQHHDAVQGTAASKPTADDDSVRGIFSLLFSDVDYLDVGTVGGDEKFWVLFGGVLSGGERVLVSRDTSQAGTTKPAFELAIVEDLQ